MSAPRHSEAPVRTDRTRTATSEAPAAAASATLNSTHAESARPPGSRGRAERHAMHVHRLRHTYTHTYIHAYIHKHTNTLTHTHTQRGHVHLPRPLQVFGGQHVRTHSRTTPRPAGMWQRHAPSATRAVHLLHTLPDAPLRRWHASTPLTFPALSSALNPRWVTLSPRTPPAVGAVGRTDLSVHYVLPQRDTLGAAPPVVRR